jgi:hypothetical protein
MIAPQGEFSLNKKVKERGRYLMRPFLAVVSGKRSIIAGTTRLIDPQHALLLKKIGEQGREDCHLQGKQAVSILVSISKVIIP